MSTWGSRGVRLAIFLIFVFVILNAIEHISDFFELNSQIGYTYFTWLALITFIFVLLPVEGTNLPFVATRPL